MENLVLHLAKSLVDDPDSVSVKINETPESVSVQLSVHRMIWVKLLASMVALRMQFA